MGKIFDKSNMQITTKTSVPRLEPRFMTGSGAVNHQDASANYYCWPKTKEQKRMKAGSEVAR